MIEIFHTEELEFFDIILKTGLKSQAQLVKEKQREHPELLHEFEEWRERLLYFSLDDPHPNICWFSILVDPASTSIGNNLLELSYEAYKLSIMPISKYLRKQEGKGDFNHPITAETIETKVGITVENTNNKLRGENSQMSRGAYNHEVILEVPIIQKFHRHNRGVD